MSKIRTFFIVLLSALVLTAAWFTPATARANGTDSYGAVLGQRVVDLRQVFGSRAADLKALCG
ncbi:hypothetical protein H6CHR_01610 [Variovorax sp. PBL-H6]|uniref:hypothetical protein n=1 Tax=Variovorax sp. PBL-H6 TaxID=434009 RepID=UPI001318F1AE|nr:hypothetical protein [Variovorax sp. PBL-H6]VTU21537.1 hypothetical protein H6CHR_01610 [Variovorax sp. PBL-H6]